MDQNNKGYLILFAGFVILVLGFVFYFFSSRQQFVSPLPSDSTVRIIFASPMPTITTEPTSTPSATPKVKQKASPTVKPIATPTVKKEPTQTLAPTVQPTAEEES